MRKNTLTLSGLLMATFWLMALSSACTVLPDNTKENMSQMASSDDVFKLQGTVVRQDLEGGFFVIASDDGQIYDPTNFPESFRKDGLKVNITARRTKDTMSSHMVGSMIEIIDISAQKSG